MPDDFVTSPATPGGATFRSLVDSDGVQWPVLTMAYTKDVGPTNTLQLVRDTDGLPVVPATGAAFVVSNSGTFAVQASQAGTWNVGTVTAVTAITNPVTVTDGGNALTVDNGGTFAVQAAQSGAWDINTVTAIGVLGAISGTVNISGDVSDGGSSLTVDAPVTTPVFVRLSDGAAPIPTLPVSIENAAATVKGTQGSQAVPVQSLRDAGRTRVLYSAVAAAPGATNVEALVTLTQSSDTSANTSATSFVIPSSKTFRITSIVFATRGNASASAQVTVFRLRINTAGAIATSSTPILLAARCATPATANSWDRLSIDIGDGIEIPGNGTLQWGITITSTYTQVPTADVLITGYLY